MRVNVLAYDKLKGTSSSYPNFGLIYLELLVGNRQPNIDLVLHNGYLSLENACRGLAGHIGKIGPLHLWNIISIAILLRGMSLALWLSIVHAN